MARGCTSFLDGDLQRSSWPAPTILALECARDYICPWSLHLSLYLQMLLNLFHLPVPTSNTILPTPPTPQSCLSPSVLPPEQTRPILDWNAFRFSGPVARTLLRSTELDFLSVVLAGPLHCIWCLHWTL